VSEHPIRVLIVDDEPLLRWALAETLRDSGCEIVEAGTAQGAIDALSNPARRFDVVVLDCHLPDAGDLTLLAATRRLSPESQAVVMSAFVTEEATSRALELGACRVLQKPVDLGALTALVLNLARATSTAAPVSRHA
jgi:DNA-binding NtrC family response regulator